MEKWKIAVIVALLATLPAYSYFQSAPPHADGPEPSPTGSPGSDENKETTPPPAHMQVWWGKKPPSFSFPKNLWANTDKPLKLEELRGKVVLLELWRANCSHCQEAAPIVENYAQQFKNQGLQVVGVHCSAEKGSIEYDWAAVKKAMQIYGIKYPVAFDEKRAVFDLFKAKKFPTFVIIDRQGIIRYAHEGMTPQLARELGAALKQVLAGKNPSWPPSKSETAEDAATKFAPNAS
jgi:peroxiredoxin